MVSGLARCDRSAVSASEEFAHGAVLEENSLLRSPDLVVTTCTASKRSRSRLALEGDPAAQEEIAARWIARLWTAQPEATARDIYSGRAFLKVAGAAHSLGADLGILSAGLGYVSPDTHIPGYDLTVSSGKAASVQGMLTEPFRPEAWWAAIVQGPFSGRLAEAAQGRQRVLVCLSSAYAAMAAQDLLRIAAATPGALRIFGQGIAKSLPTELRRWVMPYDPRLDTLSPGTRMDFAARALVHYVECFAAQPVSIEADAARVALTMAKAPAAAKRPQRRLPDAEVKKQIRDLAQAGDTPSRLLSRLRAAGWSCEQSRFARLFQETFA